MFPFEKMAAETTFSGMVFKLCIARWFGSSGVPPRF